MFANQPQTPLVRLFWKVVELSGFHCDTPRYRRSFYFQFNFNVYRWLVWRAELLLVKEHQSLLGRNQSLCAIIYLYDIWTCLLLFCVKDKWMFDDSVSLFFSPFIFFSLYQLPSLVGYIYHRPFSLPHTPTYGCYVAGVFVSILLFLCEEDGDMAPWDMA